MRYMVKVVEVDSGREHELPADTVTCAARSAAAGRRSRPQLPWGVQACLFHQQRSRSDSQSSRQLLDRLERRRALAAFQHGDVGDRDADVVGEIFLGEVPL